MPRRGRRPITSFSRMTKRDTRNLITFICVAILLSLFGVSDDKKLIWYSILGTIILLIIFKIIRYYNRSDNVRYREQQRKAKEKEQQRAEQIKLIETTDIDNLNPYEYEIRVAAYLRSKGFVNVNTTPKSGDYGADVLAEINGKKTCVQCKMYNSNHLVGVKAVQEIYTAKDYYHCAYAFIFTTSDYTEQARKLAEQLNVKLYIYK